jgi:hypothetical protein
MKGRSSLPSGLNMKTYFIMFKYASISILIMVPYMLPL